MQLDMHYYAVYALARAAGIHAEAARIISHASQFVDDALEDEAIVLHNEAAIIPSMTSHRPIDYANAIPGDQWKVWVPFHFLPGNDPEGRTFVEKMVCRKAGPAESLLLEYALNRSEEIHGLHLAGICAHAVADAYSHYGFVGLSRTWNRVDADSVRVFVESPSIFQYLKTKYETFLTRFQGSLAETVPVGHGAVATYPDRPYLVWEYSYENGVKVERNNVMDYLEACEVLHGFFEALGERNEALRDDRQGVAWQALAEPVRDILGHEAPLEDRIERWKEAISLDSLFKSNSTDRQVRYDRRGWRSPRISYHFSRGGTLADCDGCHFIHAAWRYRWFVLQELLPELGIVLGEEDIS